MLTYDIVPFYELYQNILKKYNVFPRKLPQKEILFEYPKMHNDSMIELRNRYSLDNKRKDKEIETCISILMWTFEILFFKEIIHYSGNYRALDIIEYSRKQRKRVNCAMHAIVFSEALSSLGFKCKSIQCLPLDPIDDDSHFMNVVRIESIKKWVVFDPSHSTFFLDENDSFLSLPELRMKIANNVDFKIIRKTRFADYTFFDKEYYKAYLAKNLFRFSCNKGPYYNLPINTIYFLEPEGYRSSEKDENKKEIKYIFINNETQFWED